MLHNGGVDGPVVLVGHSIGAVFARMYAERYPAEVAGMVLSDHAGLYRLTLPPAPVGSPAIMRRQDQSLQNLPPEAQALHRWAAALPHASSVPFFNQCISQLDTSKAGRPGALGNRPLIVIASSTLAASTDYRKVQSTLLALSQAATSMDAATSGHDTPLDDPATIVRAITKIVAQIRRR
jgi:pimeloyl-ACP methyl ester carboxylesterase